MTQTPAQCWPQGACHLSLLHCAEVLTVKRSPLRTDDDQLTSDPVFLLRCAEATIINWHDPDISTDIAISFQEQSGCDHIW